MGITNLNETLSWIDATIATQQSAIKRFEKLKRLKENPDFQDVIMNGYINTEAKKLFEILTDPTGASPYSEEKLHRKLASISDFIGYVGSAGKGTVEIEAELAPGKIAKEEEERIRVTAEAANGDN